MTDNQVIEIRKEIEKALHIDWEFKKAKPTRIVVDGSPTKGAYHTSYDLFVSNIVKLFEKRERQFAEQADVSDKNVVSIQARIDELNNLPLHQIPTYPNIYGLEANEYENRIAELQKELEK